MTPSAPGSSRAFPVLVRRDEDGVYVATVPDLPGCHAQGRTMEEVLERAREAILLCLEDESDPLPPAPMQDFVLATVTVPLPA